MNKDNTSQNATENITIMGIGGGGMNVINRIKENFADLKNVKLVCVEVLNNYL